MQEFSPGTRVRLKSNPAVLGVVENAKPKTSGLRVKVKVSFEDGKRDFYSTTSLEIVTEDSELTLDDILESGKYGTVDELRDVITKRRLSGALGNLIYSLHVTNTKFYPYQFLPLLTFLDSNNNSILIADEVGLGKTIEAGLIWTELRMRHRAQTLLVVAPATLCGKWQNELLGKFGVNAEILDAAGLLRKAQNLNSRAITRGAFIVSLQGIRAPKDWETQGEEDRHANAELARFLTELQDQGREALFDLLIVDEAHHIRNTETSQSKAIHRLRPLCANALFLSATPIQTKDTNLFTLLHLIDRETFPYEEQLRNLIRMDEPLIRLIGDISRNQCDEESYCCLVKAFEKNRIQPGSSVNFSNYFLSDASKKKLKTIGGRLELIRELNRFNPLGQVMTRSLKRFVQKNHVIREPRTVCITMTEAERAFYDLILEAVRKFCYKNDFAAGFLASNVLRQLSSCPSAAFEHWKCEDSSEDSIDEEDVDADTSRKEYGRLKQALNLACKDFKFQSDLANQDSKYKKFSHTIFTYLRENPNEKVIVFTFFKRTLSYLEQRLKRDGIKTLLISGDFPRQEREDVINEFEKGDVPVLLTSEVASEGIDLQFVSCLINYDLPWNPAKIEQRIGRIDRIGQASPKILIFNLIYENTVESLIFNRLYERLKIFESALGVTEKILGEKIQLLAREFFSRRLSQEEENRLVEQTQFALENCASQEKDIDGYSLVYQAMQRRVELCQELERYVVDEDLYNVVASFCQSDPAHSRLIETAPNSRLYQLNLSDRARAKFERYLESHREELDTTDLFRNPNIPIEFCNKQGEQRYGVERVTQTHPLIQFIVGDSEPSQKSTAAVEYCVPQKEEKALAQIKDGLYAFRVNQWTFSGVNRKSCLLGYCAINVETNEKLTEEDAEILVNKAARYGENLREELVVTPALIEAHDNVKNTIEDNFGKKQADIKFNKLQEADLRIRQYRARLEEIDKRHKERIEKIKNSTEQGREGRLQAEEKRFRQSVQEINQVIERIKLDKEENKADTKHVSAGVVLLRRNTYEARN